MEVPTQALHLSRPRKPLIKLVFPCDGKGEEFETTRGSPKYKNQLCHRALTVASADAMDERVFSAILPWCTDLPQLRA